MTVHIGMSGSRNGLSAAQHLWLTKHAIPGLLAESGEDWRFHHGDCVGADEQVHDLLVRLGHGQRIVIHPPSDERYRAWRSAPEIRRERTYRARNIDIVVDSDHLWAFPSGVESAQPRSGTWMTVRIARRMGVPVEVVEP